jgi:hypothetical protein
MNSQQTRTCIEKVTKLIIRITPILLAALAGFLFTPFVESSQWSSFAHDDARSNERISINKIRARDVQRLEHLELYPRHARPHARKATSSPPCRHTNVGRRCPQTMTARARTTGLRPGGPVWGRFSVLRPDAPVDNASGARLVTSAIQTTVHDLGEHLIRAVNRVDSASRRAVHSGLKGCINALCARPP